MKRTGYGLVVAAALALSVPVFAQKPANAPANATAQCTDGTFSTAKTEKGACSKHGGVKTWFGGDVAAKGETKKEAAKAPAAKENAAKEPAAKKNATREPAAPANPSASAGTAPAGSTGQCTDGSYTKAKTQKGACAQHGGVKTWFVSDTPSTAPSIPATAPKNAPVAAPKNTPAPTATPASPAPAPAPPAATKTAPTGKAPASTGKAQVVAKPADAPADATGKCRDNTYTTSKTHTGACSHHGGVAEWFK